MNLSDLQEAVRQTRPTSKAAYLRALLPDIEERLAAGVSFLGVQQALTKVGLVVTVETLKTYVYKFRREPVKAVLEQPPEAGQALPQTGTPAPAASTANASVAAAAVAVVTPRAAAELGQPDPDASDEPLSGDALVRLGRPDPDASDADMAELQHLARQRRRDEMNARLKAWAGT